jgi:tetratricopeptide (TPR) repeat protein
MVLAVGAVDDRTGVDSLGSVRVLRDLLATDLARLPGVTVVSQTRMQELVGRLAPGGETRAALTRAARNAGAAEVLEGELYRRSPRELRLDLRRVHVATGVIGRAYTAEGADIFALVERLSGQVAAELGQKAPSPSLADLTTTSPVARRFYEEGVRTWYQGDGRGALRLFSAAIAEDSTFAMAAYFASRADPSLRYRYAAHAVRMSGRATERERLLIATNWAETTGDASLVAIAESLARRFPLEPEADFALGRALLYSGDFQRAVTSLRRAADRDSLSLPDTAVMGRERLPPCTGCEALIYLVNTYAAMDSSGAAERVTREWIRRQPRSRVAWTHLARVLELQGRFDGAREAWRMRQSLSPGELPDDVVYRATMAIRAGTFAEADRPLAERVHSGGTPARNEALWWQVVSFRNQGRLVAALDAAVKRRTAVGEADIFGPLLQAQVLFEMGRPREAGRIFETIASRHRSAVPAEAPDSALGDRARHLTWYLTHAATAYAAAGDTTRLARLVDSVEVLGAQSAYGRDRRLHHHLRGLLFLARGRREEAAASFRRAIHSVTLGYTRTNLELGRVLVALGRPAEAVAVLAPALRGDLQASNLYVTHAELHEALAQAYEAAGAPDSARQHYAWVANAWRSADPPFRARAAQARRKAGVTELEPAREGRAVTASR